MDSDHQGDPLLTGGVILLGLLCVGAAGGLEPLYDRARSAYGSGLDDMAGMGEGLFSSASLAAALVFGMMGMPHLLIRFLTVPDVATARRSVVTSALLVALVVGTLLFLVGPGALVFVKGEAAFEVAPRQVRGGNNMVFIHLASAMGGELLYGLFAAIAFSTILAVVAGLGVAIASTVSRDIFATLVPDPERISEQMEMRMFRLTAAVSATLGVGLAILLQHENIAFLSALAFGIAASTNFPVLMLALYWRGLTAAGAIAGGTSGLIVAVTLLILGPTIWEKILKHPEALFPSDYTTLVAAPVTVLVAVLVSRFSSAPGRSETAPAAALQP